MRLKDTVYGRRRFLNGLFGGWLGALAASFLIPLLRFVFPPEREPDEVTLPLAEAKGMAPKSVRGFRWGGKPGLLKRNRDGSFTAFVAVCTHLDCTVKYLPEKGRFHCACHDGWYDEDGVNVAGPPPRPLRRLAAGEEGETMRIRKEASR
jgi:cytochrome b6-f complex iron-sulfur subunit